MLLALAQYAVLDDQAPMSTINSRHFREILRRYIRDIAPVSINLATTIVTIVLFWHVICARVGLATVLWHHNAATQNIRMDVCNTVLA